MSELSMDKITINSQYNSMLPVYWTAYSQDKFKGFRVAGQ
jgi:hypothetical protein